MVSDRLKQIILNELELDDWPIDDGTTAGTGPRLGLAQPHAGHHGD